MSVRASAAEKLKDKTERLMDKTLRLTDKAGRYLVLRIICQPLSCSYRAVYSDSGRYGGFFHVLGFIGDFIGDCEENKRWLDPRTFYHVNKKVI